MAQVKTNGDPVVISANGQSDYFQLKRGLNKVFVRYAGGATGTLTPQMSTLPGKEIPFLLPDDSATITGTVEPFDVTGPGLLNFLVASISGLIEVEVLS